MPIITEVVNTPDEQDLTDLLKIVRDDPALPSLDEQNLQIWLSDRLADPLLQLYAARFNDRLLAALWLRHDKRVNNDGTHQLEHLCVREITRNRGVANKFMLDIVQIADQQNWRLNVLLSEENTALGKWLQTLGFHPQDNNHYYRPTHGKG